MVNNHVHTIYSFSPYTPREAVKKAKESGLQTVGLMDHDSVGGAAEFLAAGREFGIATTVGVECRVCVKGTPLEGRRLNNADQTGVAYLALHAIPHGKLSETAALFKPVGIARGERNREMLARISHVTGLSFSYDRDVLPLSMAHDSGSVTERHLLYAAALRMEEINQRGGGFFLGIDGQEKDPYVLLGKLKVALLPRVYVPAADELLPVREATRAAASWGAVPAYAYLGDVKGSVTGDKPDMAFEDAYLEELFDTLPELGIRAVTYMPSRNTPEQLARVQSLCRARGLFEISGEDINSPGQSFVCPALARPEFAPLIDAAWALVASERAEHGLFAPETIKRWPDLTERVQALAEMGRRW
jgi:hypothetical protein